MKKENWILLTLAAVNFTHILDFMIMMPLGPQLMRIFSITPQNHAALVSAYTFSAGFAGFFMAFAIDRFDRKRALQLAYIMFCIGTLACAVSPSYEILLFTRAFTGAFGGMQASIVLAIVGDIIPLERRGAAMGIVMASFSVASVVGVPFGLYLADLISWHAPFVFVGVAGILVFVMISYILPPVRDHLHGQKREINPVQVLRSVFADINQRRALAFTMFLMLGHFMVIPFLSPFMVSNVGFKEGDLPWIYFFGGGLTIFTSPWVGRLSDKYGKPFIFTIFSCLVPIPVLWVTNMTPSPLWLALIATCLFFVTTNGRFVPSTTMVTAVVHPSHRGTFMSINSCVQQIAAGLAAYIGGSIVSTSATGELVHYNRVGFLSVGLACVALFLGRRIKMKD